MQDSSSGLEKQNKTGFPRLGAGLVLRARIAAWHRQRVKRGFLHRCCWPKTAWAAPLLQKPAVPIQLASSECAAAAQPPRRTARRHTKQHIAAALAHRSNPSAPHRSTPQKWPTRAPWMQPARRRHTPRKKLHTATTNGARRRRRGPLWKRNPRTSGCQIHGCIGVTRQERRPSRPPSTSRRRWATPSTNK